MKPNNFPTRAILDGTEELYTQTNNVSEKFLLEDAKKYANAIEVKYSELQTLISNSNLIAGSHYIITDYKTCYDQPDYDANNTPITDVSIYRDNTNVEPIIVMATGENALAIDAYQPLYPNDKIKYDVNFSITEVTNQPAFGRITERIDEYGNRTDYDHRNIVFKRYVSWSYIDQPKQTGTIGILSVGISGGLVSGDTTSFTLLNVGDIIAIPSTPEVFYEVANIVDNTTMYITGGSISTVSTGQDFYVATNKGFLSYKATNIISTGAKDFYTFVNNGIENYIGDFANYISLAITPYLLSNNVFQVTGLSANRFDDFCYNNTIYSDNCSGNICEAGFSNNIIKGFINSNYIGTNFSYNYIIIDFNANTIGKYFTENAIFGSSFDNNTINNAFTYNTIIQSFYANQIGFDFKGNILLGECHNNFIGNDFYSNSFKGTFIDNNIKNGFYSNTIEGTNFSSNVIDSEFKENVIGSDFRYNSIGYSFNSNVIKDYFKNNAIVNYFSSNGIANNFENNTIANYLTGNTIGINCQNNTINSYCTDNTIGYSFQNNDIQNYFQENTIVNSFKTNIIGSVFQSNIIGSKFMNNNICNNFVGNTTVDEFKLNVIKAGIASVDFSLATCVYGNYNCEIFKRSDGTFQLTYIDNTNTIQYKLITN